jgi:hypothetical protein
MMPTSTSRILFQLSFACVELDPHVGGDVEATRAAYAAVSDLLRQVLKLN